MKRFSQPKGFFFDRGKSLECNNFFSNRLLGIPAYRTNMWKPKGYSWRVVVLRVYLLLSMLLKAQLRICIRKQIPSNFIQQEVIQEKLKCIFLLFWIHKKERKKIASELDNIRIYPWNQKKQSPEKTNNAKTMTYKLRMGSRLAIIWTHTLTNY
jgi:hypothetical protein